ncbi:trihelix transcription factor asil2 [Phtheirospermum japonicum]|uniref:Trihelix transcription factor asil2 n=1 Tax=Phtheirospermum japonicum TaxID=374723 RepID=A0A830C2W9_9LAMI|nr:trihelix transcription factor asil2 [Phtheirospermum japonicum]
MEKNHHHHHQVPKQQERNIYSCTNERLKRDEWSEGAVSSLLESYEAKWTLRNRAKLKGQDWEDVAKHVSGRVGGSKSAKTQTQCKNKIESMKKRYRSESAAADATSSTWPLYHRLDLLLRGNSGAGGVNPSSAAAEIAPAAGLGLGCVVAHNSHGSNGTADRVAKEEGDGTTNGDKSEKILNPIEDDESDSISTAPAIYTEIKDTTKVIEDPLKKSKCESEDHHNNNNKKKKKREYWDEIGESIRWVGEVVVRTEKARMEAMKEIEKMRAEAEAKRGDIDLKRTEIIANTQLQIAMLFAKGDCNKKLT